MSDKEKDPFYGLTKEEFYNNWNFGYNAGYNEAIRKLAAAHDFREEESGVQSGYMLGYQAGVEKLKGRKESEIWVSTYAKEWGKRNGVKYE